MIAVMSIRTSIIFHLDLTQQHFDLRESHTRDKSGSQTNLCTRTFLRDLIEHLSVAQIESLEANGSAGLDGCLRRRYHVCD